MKSKAKQKTFINNMITYAIVVVAYIVVQILMGTGHMSSLMKGLLAVSYTHLDVYKRQAFRRFPRW